MREQQIADRFLQLLREEITGADYAEACARNAAETSEGICHSHDFCDANMVMLDAMRALGESVDVDSEADCKRWSAAWDLAFKAMAIEGGK